MVMPHKTVDAQWPNRIYLWRLFNEMMARWSKYVFSMRTVSAMWLREQRTSADGSFWCGQGCDLTNDGSVNSEDLIVFAENWLGTIAQ